MEKFKIGLLVTVLLVFVVSVPLLLGVIANRLPTAPTAGNNLGGTFFFVNSVRSAGATTTVTYLSTTATSTFVFNVGGISDYDLNVLFNGSTTASQLAWSFEFSNNYNENCRIGVVCAGTGSGDWFGEDSFSNDNTITTTHGARTREHVWAAATSTTRCGNNCFTKNFSTPDVRAKFVKIYFAARGAPGSLWFELGLKEPSSL